MKCENSWIFPGIFEIKNPGKTNPNPNSELMDGK